MLFRFCGSFCSHFEIVALQKDVTIIKGDANEDIMFSRFLIYKLMASKLWFRKVVCEIY